MKRLTSVVVIALVLTSNLWAKWMMIPLEKAVAEADLIVIGTLYSVDEDGDGIGKGYIRVKEIISDGAKTLENRPLRAGESLKIKWADNWACAAGMHMRRKGLEGIWLLDVGSDGTVSAAHPSKFEDLVRLDEIRSLLRQEKSRGPVAVDTLMEEDVLSAPSAGRREFVFVDVSPFADYSLTRAMITLLLSAGLYVLIYRNRFRVR